MTFRSKSDSQATESPKAHPSMSDSCISGGPLDRSENLSSRQHSWSGPLKGSLAGLSAALM